MTKPTVRIIPSEDGERAALYVNGKLAVTYRTDGLFPEEQTLNALHYAGVIDYLDIDDATEPADLEDHYCDFPERLEE